MEREPERVISSGEAFWKRGGDVIHYQDGNHRKDVRSRLTANRDDGTNDLLMGDVLRRHELQVWFLAEHLVDIRAV